MSVFSILTFGKLCKLASFFMSYTSFCINCSHVSYASMLMLRSLLFVILLICYVLLLLICANAAFGTCESWCNYCDTLSCECTLLSFASTHRRCHFFAYYSAYYRAIRSKKTWARRYSTSFLITLKSTSFLLSYTNIMIINILLFLSFC